MKVLESATAPGHFTFMCPGCGCGHQFNNMTWQFNGDLDKPTLSPSYLTWGKGRYSKPYNDQDGGWDSTPWRCHSFIKDGQIRFLEDCTHALQGKTVPLEDI